MLILQVFIHLCVKILITKKSEMFIFLNKWDLFNSSHPDDGMMGLDLNRNDNLYQIHENILTKIVQILRWLWQLQLLGNIKTSWIHKIWDLNGGPPEYISFQLSVFLMDIFAFSGKNLLNDTLWEYPKKDSSHDNKNAKFE